MKKKNIIIGIIAVFIVMISVYLLIRPKVLGRMNHHFQEQITSDSEISFLGEAGDRIRLSFSSNIEEGELHIVLHDSEGNVVYEFDRADKLKTFITLDNTDTYTLTAKHINFIGKYKIKVCRTN